MKVRSYSFQSTVFLVLSVFASKCLTAGSWGQRPTDPWHNVIAMLSSCSQSQATWQSPGNMTQHRGRKICTDLLRFMAFLHIDIDAWVIIKCSKIIKSGEIEVYYLLKLLLIVSVYTLILSNGYI